MTRGMGEEMDPEMTLVEVRGTPKARYLWKPTGKRPDPTLEVAQDWALRINIPAGPDGPLEVGP